MATKESTLDDASRLSTPIPLTEDVLKMARDARNDQGIHEQEVSFSGEAGLHDSLHSCEKNPDHHGFLPINEMCEERLPAVLRFPGITDFLVSKAKETVRLTCSYTSTDRPDNYCFSNYRGNHSMVRYGSGRVWSVYAENVRYNIPCPFADCSEPCGTGWVEEKEEEEEKGETGKKGDDQNRLEPLQSENEGKTIEETESGERKESRLSQKTAEADGKEESEFSDTRSHSETDCSKTEEPIHGSSPRQTLETDPGLGVRSHHTHQPAPLKPKAHYVSGFFRIHTAKHVVYDDAEAQQTTVEFFYDDHRDMRHVVRARGVRVARSDLDGDYCVLDCVTHDPNLGAVLNDVRREWTRLWPQVKEPMYGTDVSLVVSHPHGCAKQFSIGRCLNREWGESPTGQGWYRYFYDAPTCPGSSGAPVWVPGRDGLFSGYAPHSGCSSPNVACSAVWFYWNAKKDS